MGMSIGMFYMLIMIMFMLFIIRIDKIKINI